MRTNGSPILMTCFRLFDSKTHNFSAIFSIATIFKYVFQLVETKDLNHNFANYETQRGFFQL